MNGSTHELLVVTTATGSGNETTDFLLDSGYVVNCVASADECLGHIELNSPSLILIELPNSSVDVASLVESVRSVSESIPVIILAPDESIPDVILGLKGGASDHLLTPIADLSLLILAIERNLQHQGRINELHRSGQELERKNVDLTENLRSLERDQQTGLQVQRSMMPTSPHTVGKVTFTHHIIPSLILSGDFVDYFEMGDGRILFYIADVSGHGSSSAFVTVLLKNLSRRLARDMDSLDLHGTSKILEWLNGEILDSDLEKHVTMFLGILDPRRRTLEYSNAAHFPATIISLSGKTEFLEVGGLPLGLYKTVNYESRKLDLPEEYALVMFSDGVFEVMCQETLQAKEAYLLSLVADGYTGVEQLSDQLGLKSVSDVPDDIALFTIAGAA